MRSLQNRTETYDREKTSRDNGYEKGVRKESVRADLKGKGKQGRGMNPPMTTSGEIKKPSGVWGSGGLVIRKSKKRK